MPELPEVELVARSLAEHCAGRTIARAELLRDRLSPDITPRDFARKLRRALIEDVMRRGKHLLVKLDRGMTLIVHLRMSGRFLLLPEKAPLPPHTHALFYLDDAHKLAFTDQRHFGMMKLIADDHLADAKELRALAPEPFSDEFSPSYLHQTLARTNRLLKETLLDQTKVTGLGNIYAAEAMFRARINPFIRAAQLSKPRAARLHEAIISVLRESIAHGSTLNIDPRDIEASYYGGGHQGRWHVYDREGEPCLRCSAPIRRVARGGRSTYYCFRCQRY